MRVRRGTSAEMLALWNGRFESFVEDHVSKIDRGVQEVWLLENEEAAAGEPRLIGELHVLWDSDDKDCANGKDTAYLLAFRVDAAYQGRGLGTMLMKRVLGRVRERGFTRATIGADDYDPKLRGMYERWGFTRFIKNDSFTYEYQGREITDTYALLANDRL